MTLDKAIKILGDYKMQSAFNATPDFEDALKLGIEALKLQQVRMDIWGCSNIVPLLGETRE